VLGAALLLGVALVPEVVLAPSAALLLEAVLAPSVASVLVVVSLLREVWALLVALARGAVSVPSVGASTASPPLSSQP
jgi:hypothetical protein